MLSILIPYYNYSILRLVQLIHKQCIESDILFEIICLDDFSSIKNLEESNSINSMENCFCFENVKNLGRTQTRQLLAEKARFDWVLFLDADVVPENNRFIEKYISFIKSSNHVVFGGYKYENNLPEPDKILRYHYGKEREEKPALIRNKKPYQFVFSGNMLVRKKLFLELNYSESEKFYGMDIYFSYQLFSKKVEILHIDNGIYHLGLETNELFFQKSLQSVVSRKQFLATKPGIEQLNPLLKHYKVVKKLGLLAVVEYVFKCSEKFLKRKLLSKKPNLFYFDLYRLGFICSLK